MPALRHDVLVTVPGEDSGAQDNDTGAFVEDPAKGPTVIYDGKGFFLDQGVVVERDTAGMPSLRADGQVVVKKGSVAKFGIKDGMLVKVTYPNGDEVDASILKTVRFADILYVMRA
jgi:hypothetical protein